MDGIVLLQAECKILLLFGLGMLLKKLQLTNAEADQFLSDLLMNVLMPMNIFVSFYQSMSLEELSTCGWLVPGNTTTPMTKGMTEKQMDAALLIPIPTRYGRKEFLDASEIANAMVFLLSPLASGINGVILFVDGGIDALLRSERF